MHPGGWDYSPGEDPLCLFVPLLRPWRPAVAVVALFVNIFWSLYIVDEQGNRLKWRIGEMGMGGSQLERAG